MNNPVDEKIASVESVEAANKLWHGAAPATLPGLSCARWQYWRSEPYLAEAQRWSHTGSFGCRAAAGELAWSAETYGISGYDPTPSSTPELVLKRIHPEEMDLVKQTLDRATRDKSDLDFEPRLRMPKTRRCEVYGRRKYGKEFPAETR